MAKIVTVVDNFLKMQHTLKFLKDNAVYVGIPQKETTREGEPVTNAELLFIHTNGSPINNVPARPVIEPALEDDKDRLAKMFKVAGKLAFEKKDSEALQQLKKIGMRGQNVSRAWFLNPKNNWPPNAPSVAAAKRKKGSTDPKPLIDTGELRKSITYFVDTKGGRVE